MIVVDTSVVMEMTRPFPSRSVTHWFDAADESDLFITAMAAAEMLAVVACAPTGRRRDQLAAEISSVVEDDFAGRVLYFDLAAAKAYAQIRTNRASLGLPISVVDAQTAAICRSHGATLATRQPEDFERTGITTLDPWGTEQRVGPAVRLALD